MRVLGFGRIRWTGRAPLAPWGEQPLKVNDVTDTDVHGRTDGSLTDWASGAPSEGERAGNFVVADKEISDGGITESTAEQEGSVVVRNSSSELESDGVWQQQSGGSSAALT